MTGSIYSYACNFWTWKSRTSCTLWTTTSGFHESVGVFSSTQDCPCHLVGIYFQGSLVATHMSNSPQDCGRFLENKNNPNIYHTRAHGLRTPNEGTNLRYLKKWANVADKICCRHT